MKNYINIHRILEGCLLGDGCLEMGVNSKNSCFKYLTSSRQHAEFVHSFFKEFCSDNYQTIKRGEYFDKRTNKTYVNYSFRTKCLPFFTEQYERFYKNRIKVVPKDLVIDKNTLLFWYIGDGELESVNGYIKLHTNSFSKYEVDFLCSKLSEFESKILKKTDKHFLVTIPRNKVKLFLKKIGDCPFSDYSHKWKFVEYKNKNIELNGMNCYDDKFELIVDDFKNGDYTIYKLHKKYNVPINSIKHHFKKNGVKWNPKNVSKKILQFDFNDNLIREWDSGNYINKITGYNASAISACCSGIRKSHKGFRWKFKN